MRQMLVFLGPTKIYTLTVNEPEQIWVLILQERDKTTYQQNWYQEQVKKNEHDDRWERKRYDVQKLHFLITS